MSQQLSRSSLRSRHSLRGLLVLETGLHIGGGREQGATDSPVVRDPLGRPFIPGSSFKGAFRASVERLVPNLAHLGLHTCALQTGYAACMSTHRGDDTAAGDMSSAARAARMSLDEAYRLVSRSVGRTLSSDSPDIEAALIRLERPDLAGATVTDAVLLELLDRWLCDTCKLFGSPTLAAAAQFADLPVVEPWYDVIQARDGVGIDRDSERAREGIKYDYEVVPPGTAFDFQLTVENGSARDLGLVAIGLQEFTQGMVPLGGIRSRGLGRCHLEGLQLQAVDFTDTGSLKAYLTGGLPAAVAPDLASWVAGLFAEQEVADA